MGNMWKINALQNYTTRDEFTKLTFKKGDSFSARVLRLDGNTKDIVIKLLDGRVFPALVEGNIDEEKLENYLFKFQLSGFSGGKLSLNILESNLIDRLNDGNNFSSVDLLTEELLKNLDFPILKEDVPILKSMLKNNIELTENNLMEIKGMKAIIEGIGNNPEKIDEFINKFLEAKGINENHSEAEKVKNILHGVLKELKGFKYDDVILMKSMGINLTEEDIRSFAKVTSRDYNIFSEVKEVKEFFDKSLKESTLSEGALKNEAIPITSKEGEVKAQELPKDYKIAPKEVFVDIEKDLKEASDKTKDPLKEVTIGLVEEEPEEKLKSLAKNVGDNLSKKLVHGDNPAEAIKQDIKEKIALIKGDLLSLLKGEEKNSNVFSTVVQSLENKFQEFKMFNTLNSNYYMLNLPINLKEEEYGCKLLIKDNRGEGKKIDSQNIKIAASVDTINMDKIDAYITVAPGVSTIAIESNEKYVKVLNRFKELLVKDLSTSKYMFNITIKEKKSEFSFRECRTFFEDDDFTTINTHV